MGMLDWFLYGPMPMRRDIDARVDVGGVLDTVAGAGETALGAGETALNTVTGAVGAATSLAGDASQVEAAYNTFENYYNMYEQYKSLIYMGLIVLGIILLMCFIQCAMSWCQTCCFCVKCGYKCLKVDWVVGKWCFHHIGHCCVATQHLVPGLDHAKANAIKRAKLHYDGMDSTHWYRTFCAGGRGLPDDPVEAAQWNFFGPPDSWVRRNWARTSPWREWTVRDWKTGHMYKLRKKGEEVGGEIWNQARNKWEPVAEEKMEKLRRKWKEMRAPTKEEVDKAHEAGLVQAGVATKGAKDGEGDEIPVSKEEV